jgi:hypothetical protein
MSTTSDILGHFEETIRANATLLDANILQREEIQEDEIPDPVSIYLQVLKVENIGTTYPSPKFRLYPVEVVLAFTCENRALNENESDVVRELMGEYSDALLTAIELCNPTKTYAITNSMTVTFSGEDRKYKDDSIDDSLKGSTIYRIKQTWEVSVYES